MAVSIDRTELTRHLVEMRGWSFVNALVASGFLEWLESCEETVTGSDITAQLRQRLPAEVLHRAHEHPERREAEGPAHRCAECAFR